MIHQGDLEITKDNAKQYEDITEVTGYLAVYDNTAQQALEKLKG